MVHDWRTRGRPHQVYVIGGTALVAVKILNLPISVTPPGTRSRAAYWRWRSS